MASWPDVGCRPNLGQNNCVENIELLTWILLSVNPKKLVILSQRWAFCCYLGLTIYNIDHDFSVPCVHFIIFTSTVLFDGIKYQVWNITSGTTDNQGVFERSCFVFFSPSLRFYYHYVRKLPTLPLIICFSVCTSSLHYSPRQIKLWQNMPL